MQWVCSIMFHSFVEFRVLLLLKLPKVSPTNIFGPRSLNSATGQLMSGQPLGKVGKNAA